jgi:hypothetical protein
MTRYTVIDQNGHPRGDFGSRDEAERYLDNPPPFIDARHSHMKQVEAKWRWGEDAFDSHQQAEQMIAQHIVDGFDNSNLSYVTGADGRDYVINVSVRLEVAFDSLRRKS